MTSRQYSSLTSFTHKNASNVYKAIGYDKSSVSISYNVTGWRRFGQVIGLCVANVPCPKCGWSKTVQRAKPEHGFSEPWSRPNGRRNANRLLCAVPHFLIIIFETIFKLFYYYFF